MSMGEDLSYIFFPVTSATELPEESFVKTFALNPAHKLSSAAKQIHCKDRIHADFSAQKGLRSQMCKPKRSSDSGSSGEGGNVHS